MQALTRGSIAVKHEAVLALAWALVLGGLGGARALLSERLPARPGETCIVCDQAVGDTGAAYLYRGQRVAVCAADEERFLADPAAYAARLRPNNIVMNPEPAGDGPVWLWAGLFILQGLLFGALAAQAAAQKGRSIAGHFLAGLLFSLPGYLYAAAASAANGAPGIGPGRWKAQATRDPAPCPQCGYPNHPAADRCLGCGAALSPQVEPETSRSDAR